MLAEDESGRDELVHVARTAVDVEDAVAGFAMEVVVMVARGVGGFVAWRLSADGDRLHGTVFFEASEDAIDGADAQAGDRLLGDFVAFVDRQRSARGIDCVLDGGLLARGSSCGHGVFLSVKNCAHSRDGQAFFHYRAGVASVNCARVRC